MREIATFEGGSQPPKSKFEYTKNENNIRLVQIRDYKSNNKMVYIPKTLAKRFCNEEDIMIGRYGPPLFQILRGINGAYNVALMKAIPNEDIILKDFFYYLLKSKNLLRYIESKADRTAGQTGFNKDHLESYIVYIPDLDMQKEYVKNLNQFSKLIKKLKTNQKEIIKNFDILKKSTLIKEFSYE